MAVVSNRCRGRDMHQQTVVACRAITAASGRVHPPVRVRFGTMTDALRARADWLTETAQGMPHGAMARGWWTGSAMASVSRAVYQALAQESVLDAQSLLVPIRSTQFGTLRRRGLTQRLEDGTTVVDVPYDRAQGLRLDLAGAGIPQDH